MDMDNFRNVLTSITNNSTMVYTIYALNTKPDTFVGLKVALSQKQLKDFMSKSIAYLNEKMYSKMQIGDYPVADPKSFIESAPSNNNDIEKYYRQIVNIPKSPETNNTNLRNYDSYMIVTQIPDGEKTIFITKQNIFKTYGKKNFLYALTSKSKYTVIDDALIKLVMHFDVIIHNKNCYFVEIRGKSIFKLPEASTIRSEDFKNELFKDNIINKSGQEIINEYMKKSGKADCLANSDETIIDEFRHITKSNKASLENKYHLPIIYSDKKYHIDLSSPEKVEAFIDTITHKRGLDFNNNIVISKSPFVISQ